MVFRPEVFVSVTSPELDPYRDAVRAALREIGAVVVEQTDYSISYGPLDGVLKVAMGRCDSVIHLTGFCYGPEPADRVLGAPRRSFNHYEYDVAKALDRQIFSFVAESGTPTKSTDRGDDEARALQTEHRRILEKSGEHWAFAGVDEISELIHSLRPRLMVRRRYIRVPFAARGRQMLGRERALVDIREALDLAPVVMIEPPMQFATTSASAGKTVLAAEAGWRLFDAGRYDFVLWLPASSATEMEAEMAALTYSDALSLLRDEVVGHRLRLEAFREWLASDERAGRFLIILDGVDHEAAWIAVEAILPWFARGSVLITTRSPRELPGSAHASLGALATDAAVSLLAAHIYGGEPNAFVQKSLERVAAVLGYQPLALQLAGRVMAEGRMTPDQFLAALAAENEAASQDRSPRVIRWLPVMTQVVRRSLAMLDPAARIFLNILTMLAPMPAGIPQVLFAGRSDVTQTRNALGHLEKMGLLMTGDDGQTLFVHRLVREIVRDRLSPEDQATALDGARVLLEFALDKTERTPVQRARLVPHCRVLLGQLNGHPLEARAGRLARGLAEFLRDAGRRSEAEHFQRRSLRIAERTHQSDHPNLVPELRLLAAILQDSHRFEPALGLRRRALALLEKQPNVRMTELVGELASIATCLRGAGRLGEAVGFLRRALEVEELSSGRTHARTALACHQLAGCLELLDSSREAATFYRRALEIDEQLPICPPARIATRIHHLAGALAAAGERLEAIALYQRGLALDEQVYGQRHAELATPLKLLAAVYQEEGRPEEAASVLRRALEIEEKAGSTVPLEFAVTLASLAGVLAQQRDHAAEIERLSRRALGILDDEPKWHPLVRSLRAASEARLRLPA